MILSLISQLLLLALHIEGTTFPKPLSAKEEQLQFELMEKNDKEARNKLIVHNLRLVAHISKKYYAKSNEHDDLISIGTIGLIKAVSSFDYKKGTRFATYAARCIENEILMYFRACKKTANDVFIGENLDTENELLNIQDTMCDEDTLINSLILASNSKKLYALIETALDTRERTIICMRYGLNGLIPMPQREIAKKLNISRSYVSRIEKRALEILRKDLKE